MNSSIIDSLQANGYMTEFYNIDGVSHVQIVGAEHSLPGMRDYRRDPDVTVGVLEFEVEESSPLVTKFIAELLKVVAPADRLLKKFNRPLVRTSATTLHVLYQADHIVRLSDDTNPGCAGRTMFEHGFKFPDFPNQFSIGYLRATCGHVRLDGIWLDERTPLNTPRAALPIWNGEEIASKLRVFVDKTVSAGEVSECEPYRWPRRQTRPDKR